MLAQFNASNAAGSVFRGGSNTTHYGAMYNDRIHFDPQYLDAAAAGGATALREIANTALHEAAHVLGFSHPAGPTWSGGQDYYSDVPFKPLEPRTKLMHQILTRGARLALFGLATITADAACQSVHPELAAVNTVLDFRLNWIGDATPLNACSVYTATGRPADFPAGILPPLARGLDRIEAPCDGRAPGVPGAWTPEVLVDSIAVHGETATVFLTIHKGELTYREEYSLVNPSANRWGMKEVRTWGAVREYPSRPRTPASSE
jgi:hypothetical protein